MLAGGFNTMEICTGVCYHLEISKSSFAGDKREGNGSPSRAPLNTELASEWCFFRCWVKNLVTYHPSLSAAFTFTPKSSRNFTMWWWPAHTALCKGVIPSSLGLLGSSTYGKHEIVQHFFFFLEYKEVSFVWKLTSYMILCTRSNSPSKEASRRRANGLNFTLKPWPVLSELGFFRLVRLVWVETKV